MQIERQEKRNRDPQEVRERIVDHRHDADDGVDRGDRVREERAQLPTGMSPWDFRG